MKKMLVSLVLCFMVLGGTVPKYAVAEEHSINANVIEIVETATNAGYGIDCDNVSVEQFLSDDGQLKYYCQFESNETNGYAIVNSIDNELYIEKILLDNTEYLEEDYSNTGTGFDEHTLTVSYSDRDEQNKYFALEHPSYALSVSCVPKAATNLLGYYDRFYTELIPNFTPGYMYYGYYRYYPATNSYGDEAAAQLASDMGVVTPYGGVTVDEFKTGFQTYCSRKGLTASYSRCMSYGSFNFNTAKTYMDSDKPLIVFMSEYNMTSIYDSDNIDTLDMETSSVPHAMAAFGYRTVTYTLDNGQTRVDNYLHTATGALNPSASMLNLSYYIDIDDAYAVTIS